MMRRLPLLVAGVATVALTALTFLALAETDVWWVRMTDFPRLHYAIGLVVMLAALAVAPGAPRLRAALAVLALGALAYDLAKIGPYFAGRQHTAPACPQDERLSVMVANVQLGNRQADALLGIVRDREPDVLVALETDAWWDRQLSALSDDMPHTVSRITGGYFGMHLFSRLPLEDTRTLFPAGQDTPAILATVRLPSGDAARLLGLHPRPPHPGQSSTGRDAALMWAALDLRDTELPAILAGDLNAVPWERTVERTQRIGALLDPRDVAGYLPTYDARSWWMSWPLDQVLHQDGLELTAMEVLPGFGSDHYPVEATLCHRPSDRSPPALREGDLEEAEATLEAARGDGGGQG